MILLKHGKELKNNNNILLTCISLFNFELQLGGYLNTKPAITFMLLVLMVITLSSLTVVRGEELAKTNNMDNELKLVFIKIPIDSKRIEYCDINEYTITVKTNNTLIIYAGNKWYKLKVNTSISLCSSIKIPDTLLTVIITPTRELHIYYINASSGRIINSRKTTLPYFWKLTDYVMLRENDTAYMIIAFRAYHIYKIAILDLKTGKVKYKTLKSPFDHPHSLYLYDFKACFVAFTNELIMIYSYDIINDTCVEVIRMPKRSNELNILDVKHNDNTTLLLLTSSREVYINNITLCRGSILHGFITHGLNSQVKVIIINNIKSGSSSNKKIIEFINSNNTWIKRGEVNLPRYSRIIDAYKNKLLVFMNNSLYIVQIDVIKPEIQVKNHSLRIFDDVIIKYALIHPLGSNPLKLSNVTNVQINVNTSTLTYTYVYVEDMCDKLRELLIDYEHYGQSTSKSKHSCINTNYLKPHLVTLYSEKYIELLCYNINNTNVKLLIEYLDTSLGKRLYNTPIKTDKVILPLTKDASVIIVKLKGSSFVSYMILYSDFGFKIQLRYISMYILMIIIGLLVIKVPFKAKTHLKITNKLRSIKSGGIKDTSKSNGIEVSLTTTYSSYEPTSQIEVHDVQRRIAVFDKSFLSNINCLKRLSKLMTQLSFKPILLISKEDKINLERLRSEIGINVIVADNYIESIKNIAYNAVILTLNEEFYNELKSQLNDYDVEVINANDMCVESSTQSRREDLIVNEICRALPANINNIDKILSPNALRLLEKLRAEGVIYVKSNGIVDFVDRYTRKSICGD